MDDRDSLHEAIQLEMIEGGKHLYEASMPLNAIGGSVGELNTAVMNVEAPCDKVHEQGMDSGMDAQMAIEGGGAHCTSDVRHNAKLRICGFVCGAGSNMAMGIDYRTQAARCFAPMTFQAVGTEARPPAGAVKAGIKPASTLNQPSFVALPARGDLGDLDDLSLHDDAGRLDEDSIIKQHFRLLTP